MSAFNRLEKIASVAGESESLTQFLAPLKANCSSQEELEQYVADIFEYCAPAMSEMEKARSMLPGLVNLPNDQAMINRAIAAAHLSIFQMTCLHLANS